MHSYGGAFAWKHLLAFMHTAHCAESESGISKWIL